MSPGQILNEALEKGLGLISITDHNATCHSKILHQLAKKEKINSLLGVELTTKEEVHLLGYFPDENSFDEIENKINECLPKKDNMPGFFGYQLIYDRTDQIVGIDSKFRQNALQIGIDDLVDFIHSIGGLAIPAHINRKHCGLINQIGFLDSFSEFDAVELSKDEWQKKQNKFGDTLNGFPIISGSDSHFIEDIGLFFLEIADSFDMNNFYSFKKILEGIKS